MIHARSCTRVRCIAARELPAHATRRPSDDAWATQPRLPLGLAIASSRPVAGRGGLRTPNARRRARPDRALRRLLRSWPVRGRSWAQTTGSIGWRRDFATAAEFHDLIKALAGTLELDVESHGQMRRVTLDLPAEPAPPPAPNRAGSE